LGGTVSGFLTIEERRCKHWVSHEHIGEFTRFLFGGTFHESRFFATEEQGHLVQDFFVLPSGYLT